MLLFFPVFGTILMNEELQHSFSRILNNALARKIGNIFYSIPNNELLFSGTTGGLYKMFLLFCLLLSGFGLSRSDTPCHCLYEDIRGDWIFHETARVDTRHNISCDTLGKLYRERNFEFKL